MRQPRPPIRPYMQFLFVQSGFPLELPFPRFVTSPQLFFRSGIPHHRGSARTFTAVRISRRSYKKHPLVTRAGVENIHHNSDSTAAAALGNLAFGNCALASGLNTPGLCHRSTAALHCLASGYSIAATLRSTLTNR